MQDEDALIADGNNDEAASSAVGDYVPSTRLRTLLKGKVPAALFQGSNAYGWLISLRVFVPLLGALILLPYARARFGFWVWPVAVPIIGTLLYKVQFVQHDASHKSLFATSSLNELVGTLAGFFTGISLAVYRQIHGRHHRYNGEPNDPQFGDFLGDRMLGRWPYFWVVISPLLGARISGFMGRELKSLTKVTKSAPTADRRETGTVSVRWLLCMVAFQAVLATLATGFWRYPSLALVYFAGGFTMTLFLARVRTLAEHEQPLGKSPVGFTRSHKHHLVDAVFFYEASFNWHLEHHIFPHMPSCKLAEFSRQFGGGFHNEDTLGTSMIATVWRRFAVSPSRLVVEPPTR